MSQTQQFCKYSYFSFILSLHECAIVQCCIHLCGALSNEEQETFTYTFAKLLKFSCIHIIQLLEVVQYVCVSGWAICWMWLRIRTSIACFLLKGSYFCCQLLAALK